MAGNVDFQNSFREEAREILADLEAALLELNEKREDGALVGRAFRALHTIKGSGAMFGFAALAAFTHDLENAFDAVRKGRLAVTAELVDLTLGALDQIRSMVDQEPGAEAADPEGCARIAETLRSLAGRVEGRREESERTAGPVAPGSKPTGPVRTWTIRFAPGAEMMRNGADPLLLLRELKQMGELEARASLELPPLEELEAERCYARWEMTLRTDAEQNAIRDVFIFVEDSCRLEIEAAPEGSTGTLAAEVAADSKSAGGGAAACAADRTALELKEPRHGGGRRSCDQQDNGASLRVPAARLDRLVDLVGELVTVQARLNEIAARSEDAATAAVAEEMERLTTALRENSMNLRMLPIRATFEKFRRLVHDLARDLGKNVELTVEGADTELDKTVIEQLSDPLMHLIRNSMDHGIEPREVRAAQGKRAEASIHLSARHSGASVLVGVADDGAGIDAEAVRRRAVERGLCAADASPTEAEIYSFLFLPGFSTAEKVTDLSGRGVGMDVVRQRVESLRGSIEVTSRRGEGTSVTLRLPLTLAIIDGLLVRVGDGHFVLPLASTLECIELTREDVEQAHGKHVANVRGEIVPYLRLREYFGSGSQPPEREQIMIAEGEGGRCGLVVDEVLGNCQTVIRNLGRMYRQVQAVSGATILGDGTVALILDPQRLVQEAVRAQGIRGQPRAGPGGVQEGSGAGMRGKGRNRKRETAGQAPAGGSDELVL
ncbi:MAG TPA: chemotaxis protein CheA [Acidobacteriaceae bacterium]|nr:chemotaxis protein CheA [Acidobacteriaceae bacterium]